MKKIITLPFVPVILALCVSLSACMCAAPAPGTTDDAEIDYGSSAFYSEAEIKSAFEAVLVKFKDFEGCDLKRLWYDEEGSDRMIQRDISSGGMNTIKNSGAEPENIIVLFADYYVYPHNDGGGFIPDFTYTDWNWILIRDSANDKWEVKDWGY